MRKKRPAKASTGTVMTGEQMKAIRLQRKMTMKELAEYLGLTDSAISLFESDKCRISGPVERLMLLLQDSEGQILRKNPWNPKN